ncbi:SH3 domain-containing protein [Methylobacterium sp. Gmos1]
MLHPRLLAALLLAALSAPVLPPPAAAAPPTPAANPAPGEIGVTIGPATKLPLPRYVSLKTDRVNLREGPSKDHRTLWVFQRAGLPVEIIAEFETWRRIRDSEGTEGWVLHSLLSGRRTAVVLNRGADKGAPVPLYDRADTASGVVAQLQAGVIGSVKTCDGTWCRLIVALPQKRGDVDGYMRQDRLWGVYPNEKVE